MSSTAAGIVAEMENIDKPVSMSSTIIVVESTKWFCFWTLHCLLLNHFEKTYLFK